MSATMIGVKKSDLKAAIKGIAGVNGKSLTIAETDAIVEQVDEKFPDWCLGQVKAIVRTPASKN